MGCDYEVRFAAVARLYGEDGLRRLRQARVAVIGLGGVGSWAVEALARSGVGSLILIDLDEVCLSNVNRQLPALDGTVGRFKADVLAERVRSINPECDVFPRVEFFTESSADRLLTPDLSAVVDAIDVVPNKCRLIAACQDRHLPLIVCGGAGGRRDPTLLRVADLAHVTHDRLLTEIRRRLRRDAGFPAAPVPWGIPAVFSPERAVVPRRDGTVCTTPGSTEGMLEEPAPRRLNCDWGYGSAAFVTGAFGFAAAAWVIRHLSGVDAVPNPR